MDIRTACRAALVIALGLAARGAAQTRADDGPQAPAAPRDGPRLHVASTVIDMGEVVQGQVREVHVALENQGTAPLVVTRVEPSCGCTLSRLPDAPIPPGGKVELSLRFDSTEKDGAQSIQVLVYTNDPTQHDVGRFCTKLMLQGEVRSIYRVNPIGAFMGEVVRGEAAVEREITVTGQAEARDGFTARLAGALPDYLQVALVPLQNGPKGKPRGWTVRVTLLPHAPAGELTQVVNLETDLALQPKVRIPVVGIVTGRVSGPESVSFLRVPRGSPLERRVPLERRDGRDGLTVRRVEADPALLRVSLETISATRVDLRVSVAPGAPPGPFATLLRAHLDLPDQPVLDIPVFGVVLPRVQVEPAVLRLGPATQATAPVAGAAVGRVTVRGATVREARLEPAGCGLAARVGEASLDATQVEVVPAPAQAQAGAGPPARLVLVTDVEGEERVFVPIELAGP